MNYDQIDSQLHQEDYAKLKNKSKVSGQRL